MAVGMTTVIFYVLGIVVPILGWLIPVALLLRYLRAGNPINRLKHIITMGKAYPIPVEIWKERANGGARCIRNERARVLKLPDGRVQWELMDANQKIQPLTNNEIYFTHQGEEFVVMAQKISGIYDPVKFIHQENKLHSFDEDDRAYILNEYKRTMQYDPADDKLMTFTRILPIISVAIMVILLVYAWAEIQKGNANVLGATVQASENFKQATQNAKEFCQSNSASSAPEPPKVTTVIPLKPPGGN